MNPVCRWSSTLGELESDALSVWGTPPYNPETDADKPCVFFGMYSLVDFYALWRHKGKKWILWAGSDIRHFEGGYWLEDGGGIRLDSTGLAQWIQKYCESWVENCVERASLKALGVRAHECPSFLGNVAEYELSYQPSEKPKVYASVSGNDFELYRWPLVLELAKEHRGVEFHLYGNTVPYPVAEPNVVVHGRVSKEQMNREIKEMQGAVRLIPEEGFSEVLAKSVLWGQWPVSILAYPHMLSVYQLDELKGKKEPNIAGREYYRKILNGYPWNLNK